MDPNRFERDTAVACVDDGRYAGTISDAWAVIHGGNPNGGYVMALAARAMRSEVAHRDPIGITAHFLRRCEPGAATVDVEVVRTGRRHSTVAGRLVQDGKERVRLLGTFADVDTLEGPTRVDRPAPDYPPPSACVDVTARLREQAEVDGDVAPPIAMRFDHRIPPELTAWRDGHPTGRGEMGGHLRWADDADIDTLGLLVVADAYPPSVRNSGDGWGLGWVPTVELSVQVRKRPAPGYLSAVFATRAITNGYMEEDGEIRDSGGDLVALTRQLAMVSV